MKTRKKDRHRHFLQRLHFPPFPWLHVSTNMRQILHTSFFVGKKKNYINTKKIKHSTKINPSITHILKYLSYFSWPDATCCDECFSVVAHLNAIWERLCVCMKSDIAKAVCYWNVDLFIGSYHITSHIICMSLCIECSAFAKSVLATHSTAAIHILMFASCLHYRITIILWYLVETDSRI